jgi:hypothetical protein
MEPHPQHNQTIVFFFLKIGCHFKKIDHAGLKLAILLPQVVQMCTTRSGSGANS